MIPATALKLESEGRFPEASEEYAKQFNPKLVDQKFLRSYVYCLAMHDRPKAMEVLEQFRAEQDDPLQKAWSIFWQLPYNESIQREKHGLDTYCSNDPHEPEFIFSDKLLSEFRENLHGFSRHYSTSTDILKAASWFFWADYGTCEQYLSKLRDMESTDPRLRNVFFDTKFYTAAHSNYHDTSDKLPHPVWLSDADPDASTPLWFTACDEAFYWKYTRLMIKSLVLSGSQGEPHLHVYGECSADLICDMNSITGGRYSMSYEQTPENLRNKYYYATVRPHTMMKLVDMFSRPIANLDGDVLVKKPLDNLAEKLYSTDVLLHRMPGRPNYHSQCNGTVFGFHNTENGQEFCWEVGKYLLECYRRGHMTWYQEQTALNQIRIRSKGMVGIESTGPETYNGTYDACLVPQKVPVSSPYYEESLKLKEEIENAEV